MTTKVSTDTSVKRVLIRTAWTFLLKITFIKRTHRLFFIFVRKISHIKLQLLSLFCLLFNIFVKTKEQVQSFAMSRIRVTSRCISRELSNPLFPREEKMNGQHICWPVRKRLFDSNIYAKKNIRICIVFCFCIWTWMNLNVQICVARFVLDYCGQKNIGTLCRFVLDYCSQKIIGTCHR